MGLLESQPSPAAQGFCQRVPHPVAPKSGELRHHGGLPGARPHSPAPPGATVPRGAGLPSPTEQLLPARPWPMPSDRPHGTRKATYMAPHGIPAPPGGRASVPLSRRRIRCGERPQLTPPSWCHLHHAVPVNQLPGCRGGSPGPPAPPPGPRPIPGVLRVVCGTSGLRDPRALFPGAVRESTGPLP